MILGFVCASEKVVSCIKFDPLLSFEIRLMVDLIKLGLFVAKLSGIKFFGESSP